MWPRRVAMMPTCTPPIRPVPPIISAARVYCTEQEICDVLREVFGTYSDPAEF